MPQAFFIQEHNEEIQHLPSLTGDADAPNMGAMCSNAAWLGRKLGGTVGEGWRQENQILIPSLPPA